MNYPYIFFMHTCSESSAGEYPISGNINKVEHKEKNPSSHLCIANLNLENHFGLNLEQKDLTLLYDKLVEYVPGA